MSSTTAAGEHTYLVAIADLAERQGGVVGREQLTRAGVPRAFVRTQLRARRWQRAHPRTFVTFTGPMPFTTRVWAASDSPATMRWRATRQPLSSQD
jgi:hypothetical protein